jgi:hypothetical protein
MRSRSFHLLAGVAQGAACFAYLLWTTRVLDAHASGTAYGTAIQLLPAVLLPVLFAYPLFLLATKRVAAVGAYALAAAVTFAAIAAFAR